VLVIGIVLVTVILPTLKEPSATPTPEPTPAPTQTVPLATATSEPTPIPTEVTPVATSTSEPEPVPTDIAPVATSTVEPSPTSMPEPTPLPENTWLRPADDMIMVYIPASEFQMGSEEGEEDEKPVHTVALDGFWIDRNEVMNVQYEVCVNAGVCAAPTTCDWGTPTYQNPDLEDHPVVCVSWEDARSYCAWAGGRLPTEAEWEYAARGPDGNIYPWGDTFDDTRLNFCDVNCAEEWADTMADDGYAQTAPVAFNSSGDSWCGASDMAGNVWEWLADWYGAYPSGSQTNPEGPTSGDRRVIRGGSWNNNMLHLRSVNRDWDWPADASSNVGFRCVVVRQAP
jgi:serine/threonine-protein kinase